MPLQGITPRTESFWRCFKAELLDGGCFLSLEEAKREISHHVAHYNAQRRDSTLGYLAHKRSEIHLQTTAQRYPA
ncbi:hypothetical protein AXW84_14265 [Hymenobacter sp. PAMC 26628]|nr:hypothetical protein AXW84_14265 [Hymenobacter sp. PAMC 26628]